MIRRVISYRKWTQEKSVHGTSLKKCA